jgi:hypothetical protein
MNSGQGEKPTGWLAGPFAKPSRKKGTCAISSKCYPNIFTDVDLGTKTAIRRLGQGTEALPLGRGRRDHRGKVQSGLDSSNQAGAVWRPRHPGPGEV